MSLAVQHVGKGMARKDDRHRQIIPIALSSDAETSSHQLPWHLEGATATTNITAHGRAK